jgi:hypothetical protein
MKQKHGKDDDAAKPFNGPAGLIVFAILILASIYRVTLAIQFAGVAALWTGGFFIRVRQVAYGWRGGPPSGYITGIPAIAIGLAVVCLGIYMLMRPEVVATWGHRH